MLLPFFTTHSQGTCQMSLRACRSALITFSHARTYQGALGLASLNPRKTYDLYQYYLLNNDKTELLVLHAKHRPKPPLDSITVGDATVEHTSSARNIGAVFDDTMSFVEHVNELCRTARVKNIFQHSKRNLVSPSGHVISSIYHIRNISRIRPCLSIDSTKTLVHALVTSRLDRCNSLLYGLPDYLIQRLQYVMNAAAKVITCKRLAPRPSAYCF